MTSETDLSSLCIVKKQPANEPKYKYQSDF